LAGIEGLWFAVGRLTALQQDLSGARSKLLGDFYLADIRRQYRHCV
jgi:hypothetical protein